MRLSILMPVYNESAKLLTAVTRVLSVDYPCDMELVAVDDGSVDNSADLLEGVDDPRLVVHRHPVNRGKGAAIATAAAVATGDYLIMSDADLVLPSKTGPAGPVRGLHAGQFALVDWSAAPDVAS